MYRSNYGTTTFLAVSIKKHIPPTPAEPTSDTTRAGSITNPADETDEEGIARNLLVQAELLEADARKKRDEAEQVSPGIQVKLGKATTVVTKRSRGRPKKAEVTTTN